MQEQESEQQLLFKDEFSTSNADKERFNVIDNLLTHCRNTKLSTGIDSNSGLKTYNPDERINFWYYIPQRVEDKAPVRQNK